MASKVPIIVYDYVRRALVKSSEGIASLPNKQAIMSSMQDIFNRLKSGGYNAITAEKVIKNQDDLRKVLNTIDADEIANITKRKKQSEGIQEVMDKMEKGVPLNPSDQAKMEGGTPDKVLDAFRGFEPKIIQGGKAEGIEKLLKSGDVKRGVAPKTTKETIERKSMIDPKLTEEENIKNIMAENKAAAKRLEQKMNPEKDLGDRLKDYDGDPDAMAQGGIAMLAEGGPENKGRRKFLKLMGGLASLPIIGKFIKPGAKVAEKIAQLKNTSTTMPAWFPKFVDKVMSKGVGTKIDADIMKYEVKELPGIQVTKHDDGRIYVEGKNDYGKSYDIEYQPPGYEVTDYKTGKAVKTKGDFTASEEVPVNMDPDGNVDFEGEILEEVGDILTSDGRVMEEFATGSKIKNPTRGEHRVGQAEVAAENAADEAAERAAMEAEDFATGGLAHMLGE